MSPSQSMHLIFPELSVSDSVVIGMREERKESAGGGGLHLDVGEPQVVLVQRGHVDAAQQAETHGHGPTDRRPQYGPPGPIPCRDMSASASQTDRCLKRRTAGLSRNGIQSKHHTVLKKA